MDKKIEAGVAFFRRFMEQEIADSNPKWPLALTKWEVKPTEHGTVWIAAELEMTTLPENNMLRAVARQWWHVHVGVRGGVTVYSAPKEFHQFSSRRAFGMKFKLRNGTRKQAAKKEG